MIETVDMMRRCYERALSYGMKVDNGMSRRTDERRASIERSEPYVVREGITITMDEIAGATDVGVRRSSTAGFLPGMVVIIRKSTLKTFSQFCEK